MKKISALLTLLLAVVGVMAPALLSAEEISLERPYRFTVGDLVVYSSGKSQLLTDEKGDFQVWEDDFKRRTIYSANPLLPRVAWRTSRIETTGLFGLKSVKESELVKIKIEDDDLWKFWPLGGGHFYQIWFEKTRSGKKGLLGNPIPTRYSLGCEDQGGVSIEHPLFGLMETVVVECKQYYEGRYLDFTKKIYLDLRTGLVLREQITWFDGYKTDLWTLAVLSGDDATSSNIDTIHRRYKEVTANKGVEG